MIGPDSIPPRPSCALPAAGWRSGMEPGPTRSEHAAEIAAHWQRRSAESPALFDGRIFLLEALRFSSDALEATFLRDALPQPPLLEGVRLSRPQRARRVRLRAHPLARGPCPARAPGDGPHQRGARVSAGRVHRRARRRRGRCHRHRRQHRARDRRGDRPRRRRTYARAGYHVTLAGPLVSIAAEFCSDLPSAELAEAVRATSPPTASPNSPPSS